MGRGEDAMRTGIAELTITDRHSRLQLTEVMSSVGQSSSIW